MAEDRVVDGEQVSTARHDRVLPVGPELVDADVVVRVDVGDVEEVVGRVAGTERDREEAVVALVVPDDAAEVGERVGAARPLVQEHPDLPRALDDVEVPRAPRRGHARDVPEPARDRPDGVTRLHRTGRSDEGECGQRHGGGEAPQEQSTHRRDSTTNKGRGWSRAPSLRASRRGRRARRRAEDLAAVVCEQAHQLVHRQHDRSAGGSAPVTGTPRLTKNCSTPAGLAVTSMRARSERTT